MISQIRNSVFSKILWGMMGLYLFNISVDSADPNPEHIPEDLSINDQESIIELVVEKILGYENAIKEYDDPDTEDQHKKKNIKIDFLVHPTISNKISSQYFIGKKQLFFDYEARLKNVFIAIDTPPPKV